MLLRDTVYHAIRQAIITCELQPGLELREQVLAEQHQVSRSPIRDALLRLELENLVTVLPRQGYRVNPIAIPDARDVLGFRLLMEPACVAAAAQADDPALQALDRFRNFETEGLSGSEYLDYDFSFHKAIIELSGRTRMATVGLDLLEQFKRLERAAMVTGNAEDMRRHHLTHQAIIDALQTHHGELAFRLCHDHAAAAHDRIIANLQYISDRQEYPAHQPDPQEGPSAPIGSVRAELPYEVKI